MNKRNIFLWTLYDFANSIVTIVFFLYFSQWLVVDNGVSDIWYNMIFTIGSVLLLLTSPILGTIADKTGRSQNYLNHITVLVFIFFLLATFTTLFFSQKVFLAALFFVVCLFNIVSIPTEAKAPTITIRDFTPPTGAYLVSKNIGNVIVSFYAYR